MKKSIVLLAAALFAAGAARAQDPDKKTWEIGLGGSVFQFNRFGVAKFVTTDEGHYVDMQLHHAVYGANLSLVRELSNVFAADLQGTVGFTKNKQTDAWRQQWFYTAGLGLQWRLGHYFRSSRIDPYLRVGGNYLYKGFDVRYGDAADGMDWNMVNNGNKEGADDRHLFTAAAGAGVDMWLDDRWGIGLQGDYIIIPKPNVANSLQGTVRVMRRFGRKSTKPVAMPAVPVIPTPAAERVVVRDTVYVEKEVSVEVDGGEIHELIRNIHFDFDACDIKPEYRAVVENIAELLKKDTSRRYLITGYTDARGSDAYDEALSRNRAKTILRALVEAGVPETMLKSAGVGKRISHASPAADEKTREGDRKVTIERIDNGDYWRVL